jgi:hypothetical protein
MERAGATTARRNDATRESHDATEQVKMAAILAATSRRHDRCDLQDGIRSAVHFLSNLHSPT